MSVKTITTIGVALVATTLPCRSLRAQEVIDLPGPDRHLAADFDTVVEGWLPPGGARPPAIPPLIRRCADRTACGSTPSSPIPSVR